MTPRSKRVVAMILVALAAGLLIYWKATSGQNWTTTETAVKVTDELFGTESEKWVPEYKMGLLDLAAPVAGGLIVVGGVFFWLARRQAKRASSVAATPTAAAS